MKVNQRNRTELCVGFRGDNTVNKAIITVYVQQFDEHGNVLLTKNQWNRLAEKFESPADFIIALPQLQVWDGTQNCQLKVNPTPIANQWRRKRKCALYPFAN